MSSSQGGRPPGKPGAPGGLPPRPTIGGMPAPRAPGPSHPPPSQPAPPQQHQQPAPLPPAPLPPAPPLPPLPTARAVPQPAWQEPSGPHAGVPQPLPPQSSSGQHHSGPVMGGPAGYPPAAYQQASHSAADAAEEVPGSQFVKFLKISARRAFRLRIEPSEVLPGERAALERSVPPIVEPQLQAFLAWRRSVLFLVACALVPLSVIGLLDAMAASDLPTPIRVVKLAPALAEALFCAICWRQLKRWAHWRTQRRWLFWGWLGFMLTPFVVFLYPLGTILVETVRHSGESLRSLGVMGTYRRAVMPFVASMIAMLQLAPKAISLMPGLIRSSLVIKLLFPGSTAPGWLIVLCTPLYALLAYVILIVPYQFTGSGWFISGVLGVIVGQAVLARAGFQLARPLTEEEALVHIKRVRLYYMTVMAISAALIVIALGSLVDKFNMRWADVVTAVLKFEANVLILTMIGADLVITNLDRARSQTVDRAHVEEQAEVKIAAFVSLAPPPSGPPR